MTDLTMSQFASKDDLLAAQAARIAELESQLEAIGAGGVEPLRKQVAAQQAVPASVIAGAVFDFAGYLTTLPHKEAIHCSEAHEAAPMVEAITEWCKRRNLTTDGAKVETWRDHLAEAPAHPAEGVPEQAAKLPPLPEPTAFLVCKGSEVTARAWNVDQMRAYAAAALAATQPAAQGMEAPNEWEEIHTLPTCDDLIWLYCQDTNTIDGPIAPDPSLEQYGWTHWAYANAPSTAGIDTAQAKQGSA